jgi:transposase-like protein
MQGGTQTFEGIERHRRPLCCRYLLLHVEAVSMPVRESGALNDQTVRWALGVLANGEYEALGAWPKSESHASAWHEVFEDLQVRGVEKVRFIASSERGAERAEGGMAPSGATVLPSTGQMLRQSLAKTAPRHRRLASDALRAIRAAGTVQAARAAVTDLEASPWGAMYPAEMVRWRAAVEDLAPFFALRPRLRRLVHSGGEVALRVAETLQRAVARKGCFPTETAAVTFVSQVLDRMNRDFGYAGSAADGVASGRVRRPGEGCVQAACH